MPGIFANLISSSRYSKKCAMWLCSTCKHTVFGVDLETETFFHTLWVTLHKVFNLQCVCELEWESLWDHVLYVSKYWDFSGLQKVISQFWTLKLCKRRFHPNHLFTVCSISGERKTCKGLFHKCILLNTGCFFTGPPPKKLKYGKPRLGEVSCI